MKNPYRIELYNTKDNKLMTKEAKLARASRVYKNGAQVLVKYFERKEPVKDLNGKIIGQRIICEESIETVSTSLARVLIATNQAEVCNP